MLLLGMVLALLADAPLRVDPDGLVSRGSRIPGLAEAPPLPTVDDLSGSYVDEVGRVIVLRNAARGVACQRVDTQYVEIPKDDREGDAARGATPMTRLPDADLIRAVLRSVDGRCEVVVVKRQVSTREQRSPNPAP